VDGFAGDEKGKGLVVTTLEDLELGGRMEMKILEEFEETFVFLVDAENFGAFFGPKVGEKDAALLAELGDAAVDGHAVGTGFATGETLEKQRFDFRGDGVLHALGFRVRFGPREADYFGEQHFGELMAEHEALRDAASLGGELDGSAALDFDVAIASHALDGSGDRGRGDVKLFGQTRADGSLLLFEHFPNGLEVIFLRNAGSIPVQGRSVSCGIGRPGIRLRPDASR